MKTAILAALFCLSMGACSRTGISSIDREDLFSLEIGRLEDQLALYGLEGDLGLSRVDLVMREGLFYISDRNGGKVVRYNSYGDLLSMIYNDEFNSAPLGLKTNQGEDSIVTRWAFTYPLREPGRIAVDSRKHIYVEDRLPDSSYHYDADTRALLDSVVLHFDQNGRFVEYLGQEGAGGTPFSRIIGIYTTGQDEIVVVCRQTTGWTVYRYGAGGRSPLVINLKNDAIPVPADWSAVSASVDAIMAAPDSRDLYLKVDYYRDIYDDSTGTRVGTEPDNSLIWVMDLNSGAYVDCFEVPFLERTTFINDRRESLWMLYSMMGIARGGRVFLLSPVDEGYSILILRRERESPGSSEDSTADPHTVTVFPSANIEQRRGLINVDQEELYLNSFDLSGDGIISAILVSDYEAKVVWWRTDKILTEGVPSWP
ncbi:MAG: hypothetical protein LBP20_10085 [Treponema sp.]|nr:hypothetical protein [Treponema sp.]